MTKKFIFKLLESEITTKYLTQIILQENGATDDRLSKTEFGTEPEIVGRGIRKQRAKKLSESDELRISRSRKSARPRSQTQVSFKIIMTFNLKKTNIAAQKLKRGIY